MDRQDPDVQRRFWLADREAAAAGIERDMAFGRLRDLKRDR